MLVKFLNKKVLETNIVKSTTQKASHNFSLGVYLYHFLGVSKKMGLKSKYLFLS